MQYFITFLEGLISFVSPCMLPMLPVYVSYFAATAGKKRQVLARAAFFVLGFTVVFSLLGLFAGTLGSFLVHYKTAVNVVCGLAVIGFGLGYLEVIRLPFFKGMRRAGEINGIFSAFLFPCNLSLSCGLAAHIAAAGTVACSADGVCRAEICDGTDIHIYHSFIRKNIIA